LKCGFQKKVCTSKSPTFFSRKPLAAKQIDTTNMEIAKGIKSEDYLKLDLSDYKNDDWFLAFTYLEKRLYDRFIEPIQVLQAAEIDKSIQDKKFGFTILAIDCMLIETIQSFYEGVTNSHGQSQNLFKTFLTKRENFKSFFASPKEAGEFYINFRCGILHQAQTFGETKIWTVGELIRRHGKYIIVNRELFHIAVMAELKIYLELLNSKTNTLALDNFKIKMDFIAGK
jgi:hypothetical protein